MTTQRRSLTIYKPSPMLPKFTKRLMFTLAFPLFAPYTNCYFFLNYSIQNLTHGKKRSSTWTSFMVLAYEAFSVKLMSSTYYTINCCFPNLENLIPWSFPLGVCILRWFTFFKNKSPQKSILQCSIFEIFWYQRFNGNKVHVSKAIKSILIEAHLYIPNIYTFKKKLKNKKTNYVRTYEDMAQFWPFKNP
jgi:hypothetical protein